jgi:hypothetical protein
MKVQYCPINSETILAKAILSADKNVVKPKRQPVNHIMIYDRSGSMSGMLSTVIEDMILSLENIKDGDTLSIGWFASEGRFGYIINGMFIKDNREKIVKILRQNNFTLGMTCFSDILGATNDSIIPELSNYSNGFNLMFFTDGYPVVNDYSKEVKKVFDALEKMNRTVNNAMLVGYGDYYNKELMAQMAEKIGGTLVHQSKLDMFSGVLMKFLDAGTSSKKIEVEIPIKAEFAYVINVDSIVLCPVVDDTKVIIPEDAQQFYFLSNTGLLRGVVQTKGDTSTVIPENMIEGVLGAANIAIGQTKTTLAIDLLGKLGDIRLINVTNNAFTNAEYALAQDMIRDAISNPSVRFIGGKNKNYVPDPSAFCLMNALEVLGADDNAFFYPRHKAFEYNKIGVPSFTKEGYPKMVDDPNTKCKFDDLVWNGSRLNLSIRAIIKGTVELNGDPISVGLPKTVTSFKWRNYTIIKDGHLNVFTLPVSMSYDTFEVLRVNGMIDRYEEWDRDTVYEVYLDAVPMVNRAMTTPPLATEFCVWHMDEKMLEARIKATKGLLDKLDPEGTLTKEHMVEYTPEQEAFLEAQGITSKGFNPPTTSGIAEDWYHANEFEVKIAGLSSLPSYNEVVKKIDAGKSVSDRERPVYDMIMFYESKLKDIPQTYRKIEFMQDHLEDSKTALRQLRHKIHSTKMGMLLSKQWFPDITTRDGSKINIGETEFTISIRQIKVDY